MNKSLKKPIVEIDKSLDLPENKVYATKKVAKGNAILAKTGLPKQDEGLAKMEALTSLQVELLHFYTHNPSETQMKQLKDFLEKLFSNNIEKIIA